MAKFARNPIVLTIVAAAIVVMAISFAAALSRKTVPTSGDAETVATTHRVVLAPQSLGAPQPQLKVHAPSHDVVKSIAPKVQRGTFEPQIARTGKLTMLVPNVQDAVRAVSFLARSNGGDVFSSQVDTADDESGPSAQMEIRVPSDRFDSVMNGAGGIGKVQHRETSAEDLSSDITDSSARLRNLRRTESDMLNIMDRAGTISQVMDAENQLSQVREQIETLESELKAMYGRVQYATISISMQAELAPQQPERAPSAQLLGAWRDALHSLTEFAVALAAAIVWCIVYLPVVALLALASYAVYVRAQRQRADTKV